MKDWSSIFDDMTDEKFENMLIEMGIDFKKVGPREGGITYKGQLYQNIDDYDKTIARERIKNKMEKKVSIITPCFNGEEFIERYLISILNQTYINIELILINDGSTDKTEEIIKSYIPLFKQKGIDIIYLYQENLGQAAALNKGLKVFSGDYLTWPDSDDMLTIDSIEKKVKFLENNPQYSIVRTDGSVVDENNINKVLYRFSDRKKRVSNNLFLNTILEKDTWIASGCYMVRTNSFINSVKDRTIYECRGGQNWQMLLPIMYRNKCGYIDESLYTYIIRSNSHSHINENLYSDLEKCKIHEDILINTINSITMSEDEKEKYIKIIKEKYIRKKFNIAIKYKDKTLISKFYNNIKQEYKVTLKEKIKFLYFS